MKVLMYPHEHAALLESANVYSIPVPAICRGAFGLRELDRRIREFIAKRTASQVVTKKDMRTCSIELKVSSNDRSRIEEMLDGGTAADLFRKNIGFLVANPSARAAGIARRKRSEPYVFIPEELAEYEAMLRDEIAATEFEKKKKEK